MKQNKLLGNCFLLAGTVLLVAFLSACGSTSSDQPKAIEGVLNLRDWDFNEYGAVKLNGQWEFYWSELLESKTIKSNPDINPTGYLEAPGIWRYRDVGVNEIPWQGFATLRLKIELPPKNPELFIELKDIRSSYELEANGKIIASSGVVGTSETQGKPEFKVIRTSLPVDYEHVEIIIRLSDFHRDSGGMPIPIVIGTAEQILTRARNSILEEWLLIGFLLFSAIYHFGLYFLRRREILYLYFGVFCIDFIIRLLTRGEKILYDVLSLEAWWVINKLEFITLYLVPFIYLAYYNKLFVGRVPGWLYKTAMIFFGSLAAYALVVPSRMVTYSLDVFLYGGVISVFCLVHIAFRAYRDQVAHSGIFLLGFVILLAGVINDFLYFNYIIRVVEVFNYSAIIFIFSQAYGLATRSARAFDKEEKMSKSLDIKVMERTEQLSKANMVKGKLLSIVSHDLRGPLTSLYGLVELAETEKLDKKDEKKLLQGIRQSLESSLMLLDNILLWASSQLKSNVVNAQFESLRLKVIVQEAIKPYRVEAEKKKIALRCNLSESVTVQADRNMLKSVIRNLISNALKYTLDEGEINIFEETKGSEVIVSIADTGIGLPQDLKSILFNGNLVKSRLGTSKEKGIGVGLLLCEDLINQMNGKIWVESIKNGTGTVFSFSLPKAV